MSRAHLSGWGRSESNHVSNSGLNIYSVGDGGRVGNGTSTNNFTVSVCLYIYAFMWHICMCVWILFVVEGMWGWGQGGGRGKWRKGLRPAASWTNWQVNHVSAGTILARAWSIVTYLGRFGKASRVRWAGGWGGEEGGVTVGVHGLLQKQESKWNTRQPVCGNEGSSVFTQMLSPSVAFSHFCKLGLSSLLLHCWCLVVLPCFSHCTFTNHTIKKRKNSSPL